MPIQKESVKVLKLLEDAPTSKLVTANKGDGGNGTRNGFFVYKELYLFGKNFYM